MRKIYQWLFCVGMLVYCMGFSGCARDAQRHYQLGKWYYDKGLINEAILEYKEAVRLNPRLYPAHHGLALAYTKKGWYEYALKEAETSFDLHPTDEGYRLIQLIKDKQRLEPIVEPNAAEAYKP